MIAKFRAYTVELTDDGTLDTVVLVYPHIRPERRTEMRYSGEMVSYYREKDGSFTEEKFREFAKEVLEDYNNDLH